VFELRGSHAERVRITSKYGLTALIYVRSLDELDDDLLLELNQVAHDNQLAYLPFARSGRAEAVLFDLYPELAERIERSKRAKIDAIVLSNKYADGDGLSTSFRAQSLEEVSASPLRQRTKRRASKDTKSPALTPALKGKASVQDLMFEMSDGDDDEEGSLERIEPPQFKKSSAEKSQAKTPLGSPEVRWSAKRTQSRNSPSTSDKDYIPMQSLSLLPSPAVQAPRAPGQPWGAAPLSGAKLGLKDIMATTSTSSPSNLTLGLSKKDNEQKAAASQAKLSQKERKRLQQAYQLGSPIEKPQPAPPSMSPWQAKPSNTTLVTPAPQSSPKASPQPSRAASTPQLNMRQTIANNGTSSKQKGKRSTSQAIPESSSAASPKRPGANERGMSVSTDPIPTPRSVRHIPLPEHSPTSPSQNLSMMEILSLQEAEKVSIRDAAAKRSLQEIQAEQEFQAWWDEESKRVIQEEEQRKRAEDRAVRTAARAKSKPRGGRGGKGKTHDKKDEEGDRGKQNRDLSQEPATTPAIASLKPSPKHDGVDRGRARGRGHRGGRGGPRGGRMQGRQRNDVTTAGAQDHSSAL
jgi:hypothetical protein